MLGSSERGARRCGPLLPQLVGYVESHHFKRLPRLPPYGRQRSGHLISHSLALKSSPCRSSTINRLPLTGKLCAPHDRISDISLSENGMAMTDSRAIILAYRQLYRRGLQVINYSTPARHVLLRILRSSFRTASRDDFDPKKIAKTLEFLQRASESAGLEHKIIKNIIMVRYWEQPQIRKDVKV